MDQKATTKGRVKAKVNGKMSEEKAAGKTNKEITLVIVAEMGVPIEHVVFLMDMATRLNINAILATDPVE